MNTGHLPVDLSVGRPASTREWLGLAVAAMLAMVAFAISSVGGNVPVVRAADPVTIEFTAADKSYDGNTDASILTCFIVEPVAGDVTCDSTGATASFEDKTAADGKTVNGSGFVLAGVDKGNYTLTNGDNASTTANITPKPLAVTATGVNKVYDGGMVASVTLGDDRLDGDIFSDSYSTAAFGDKNVANGKAVSVSGISIAGTDAGNYSQNTTTSTTANITPKPLAVTATGVNKVYDGGMVASVTLGDDRLDGDIFSDSYSTAAFGDKNTSAPVQVTAYDKFGNLAGPGTLGADGGTAPVYVTIKDGGSSGTTLASSVPTSGGVVSFVDATPLKISTLETTRLYATATQAATLSVPAGSVNQPSRQIRIVLQVSACTASTKCSLTAKDMFSPKPGTQLPENAYGQIVGQSNLYAPGTSTNVLLTTNFLPASSVDGQCKTTSPSGTNSTIGTAVELRLTGVGITNPKPSSTMLIILPMKTLQYYSVASRNAAAFNVCLGSFNLSLPTTPFMPWMSVESQGGAHASTRGRWYG